MKIINVDSLVFELEKMEENCLKIPRNFMNFQKKSPINTAVTQN